MDLLKRLRGSITCEEQQMALDNCIGLFVTGSQLYGTNTPASDCDYEGVFIETPEYILGNKSCDEVNFSTGDNKTRNTSEDIDCKLYSLRKYFTLAQQNNPNKVEWFFIPNDKFIFKDDVFWNQISESQKLFLSLKLKHSFSGYAKSQEHKLVTKKRRYEELKSFLKVLQEGLDKGLNVIGDLNLLEDHEIKKYHRETDSIGVHHLKRMKEKYNFIEYKKTVEGTDCIVVDNKEYNFGMSIHKIHDYVDKEVETYGGRLEYLREYGYDCYHPSTEFLTDNGWEKYDAIMEDTLLGTLSKEHTLEFQKYDDRIKKYFEGSIYHFESTYTKMKVTPEHRLYLSPCHRSKKNNYSSKYTSDGSSWDYIKVDDLVNQNRSKYHVLTSVPNPNQIDYPISDDYLRIMGLYISEGSSAKFNKNKGNLPRCFRITQTNKGKKEVFEILDKITEFSNLGFNKYSYPREDKNLVETTWITSDKELVNFIYSNCGHESLVKRLPNWIMKLSERQALILKHNLLLGDGTFYKNGDVYYTTSEKLGNYVQILSLICGQDCNLRRPYTFDTSFKKGTTMYQVYLKKSRSIPKAMCFNPRIKKYISSKKGSKLKGGLVEKYCGDVVCFSVPNGNLITRLDGKIAIQGNCKFASHLFRLYYEGLRLLREGNLLFPMPEEEIKFMKDIKAGAYDLDFLLEKSKELEPLFDIAYDENKAELPYTPNHEKIDKLQQSMILDYWVHKGYISGH
jgi:predicted nucleotidyltransferase